MNDIGFINAKDFNYKSRAKIKSKNINGYVFLDVLYTSNPPKYKFIGDDGKTYYCFTDDIVLLSGTADTAD